MNIHVEGRDGLTEAALRRVGTILKGKWRLDALLGIGGTAAVFAATHRNGNRVAIKVLHAHFSLDEAVGTRLQQEGYVANLIDHPGAVRILDDDRTEDGAVFLVMELLSGEGLDARLKRKGWRLPETEALGIIHSLLDVIAAAHAKGVVHRDIKPDNIFVTREGQIKVLDFGIARLLELPAGMNRTHNGALFGTLGFMAPEQALARSHEIDGRTDLWAVGATLFTLLTGRLVHEAPTPNEQLVNAATRVAPPLVTVMPDVSPALAELVDRALAFQPVDRWQNALEMQEAVRGLVLATAGPQGVPVLQGPRLSVEVDLPGEHDLRGPWGSSLRSSPAAAPVQVMESTLVVRGGRRWSRGLAVAAAFGTMVLGGALVQRGRVFQQEAQATVPSDSVPSVIEPPASSEAVPAPLEGQARPPIAPLAVAAESDGEAVDSVKPRRRLQKRVVRSDSAAGASTSSTATQSIADNDALWGKRH